MALVFWVCLFYFIFSTVEAEGKSNGPPFIGRFALRNPGRARQNMTAGEKYVKMLTSKRPTRRSTAQRRQSSDTPVPVDGSSDFSTPDGTITGVMKEVFFSYFLDTDNSSPGATTAFTFTAPASWTTRTDQRLTLTTGEDIENYPIFALSTVQGYGSDLRPGSANFLRPVSAASPGSAPGARPAQIITRQNQDGTTGVEAETDIWNIDRASGTISPTWVNPDGSTFPVYFAVPVDSSGGFNNIIITADIAASSAELGVDYEAINFSYTTPSP